MLLSPFSSLLGEAETVVTIIQLRTIISGLRGLDRRTIISGPRENFRQKYFLMAQRYKVQIKFPN